MTTSSAKVFTITTAAPTTAGFVINTKSMSLQAAGTFGSGTLKLQIYVDALSSPGWQDMESGSWTSGPVSKECTTVPGQLYRLTLSGSSGATINAVVG